MMSHTRGESCFFYGEHLEHTQKVSSLDGLAGLSSAFLEALAKKQGELYPRPKQVTNKKRQ